MKKYINLLPPEEQKQIAAAARGAQVLSFGFLILFSVAALAVVLFAYQFWLAAEFAAGESEVHARSRALSELQNSSVQSEIANFNADLKNFSALARTENAWGPALFEIVRVLPADLTVDKMSMNAEGRVELSGRASARASVLQLRQNILGSEFFANVNFPLKNLEKARDGAWSYKFYVRK